MSFTNTPNKSLKKPTLGLSLPLTDTNNPAKQFNDNLDVIDQQFFADVSTLAEHTDFAAAITAIGGATRTLIIPTVTASITSNVTVPSNVTLKFTGTGQLNVGSGFTVTINGPLDAPLKQIFSGAGSVTGLKIIKPEWWGAKGDNTNDDTSSIQSAAKALLTYGEFIFNPGSTYKTTSTIDFNIGNYTVTAIGAIFRPTNDGVLFNLNSGANLATLEATIKKDVTWRGGHFINGAGTKTASEALRAYSFRNLNILDFYIEGFFRGINFAGRDTINLKRGHFFDNTHHVIYPDVITDTALATQVIHLENLHFSAFSATDVISLLGSYFAITIENCSFNYGNASTAITGIIFDNAVATASQITIRESYWESVGSNNTGIHFKDTAGGNGYLNIVIDGNGFNNNGTNSRGVVMERVLEATFSGNRFYHSTATTNSLPVTIDANSSGITFDRTNRFSTAKVSFSMNRSEITFQPEYRPVGPSVVTGFNGASFTSGSATIDMSVDASAIFPTEANPKGYIVNLQAMDSGSAASTTDVPRIRLAESSVIDSGNPFLGALLSLSDTPNDTKRGGQYFVEADTNGDIFIKYDATGTLTLDIWVSVVAVLM